MVSDLSEQISGTAGISQLCCNLKSIYFSSIRTYVDRDTLFLQFLHWAVGNVQGNNFTSGDIIASYLPPYPPAPAVGT